jgi:DNA-binding Lrp family transcriptional regulator
MELSALDRSLLARLADGLPITSRPYADLAASLDLGEDEVIARIGALIADGTIRRFGIVVRHRELGYRANAMVVWDVPADWVDAAGRQLAELPYVTLAYRRPKRQPVWPYNLFCMIHGRDRGTVRDLVEEASNAAGLSGLPRAILFSRRCFKQHGARYNASAAPAMALGAPS